MLTLGSYIKEIRQQQNLSIRKLALLSGVSHSEISKIETDKRQTPLPSTLALISKALNVSQHKLYFLAGYISQEECSLLSCEPPISFEMLSKIILVCFPSLSTEQKNELINMLNTKK